MIDLISPYFNNKKCAWLIMKLLFYKHYRIFYIHSIILCGYVVHETNWIFWIFQLVIIALFYFLFFSLFYHIIIYIMISFIWFSFYFNITFFFYIIAASVDLLWNAFNIDSMDFPFSFAFHKKYNNLPP